MVSAGIAAAQTSRHAHSTRAGSPIRGEVAGSGLPTGEPRPAPLGARRTERRRRVRRDLDAWLLVLPPRRPCSRTSPRRGCCGWHLPALPEQVPVFAAVERRRAPAAAPGLVCSRLVRPTQNASPSRAAGRRTRGDPAPGRPRPRRARPGHHDRLRAGAWRDLDERRMERPAGRAATRRTSAARGVRRRRDRPCESAGETVLRLFHHAMERAGRAAGRAVRRRAGACSRGRTCWSPARRSCTSTTAPTTATGASTAPTCAASAAGGLAVPTRRLHAGRPAQPSRGRDARARPRARPAPRPRRGSDGGDAWSRSRCTTPSADAGSSNRWRRLIGRSPIGHEPHEIGPEICGWGPNGEPDGESTAPFGVRSAREDHRAP